MTLRRARAALLAAATLCGSPAALRAAGPDGPGQDGPGPPAAAPRAPAAVHACVRLPGLPDPTAVAATLRDRAGPERRARLVAALRGAAEDASRPLAAALRAGGARDLRVLWGAGVLCGWAPPGAFRALEAAAGPGSVFEDPPRADADLDDAGGGPNPGVPPEAPLVALRVPEAWQRGFTGDGVVVALIDTGADLAHPDLAPSLWVNAGEVPGNGLDDDGNGYPDDVHGWDFASRDPDPTDAAGHGTNVAGLLAGNGASGRQTGVAPGIHLMVLRRGTTEASLWECAQYAVANGAAVITQSSSWRWSFNPRPDYAGWRRQADTELAAGVLHVNSSGNNGQALDTDPVPYNVGAPANVPPPWLPPAQALRGGVSSVVAVGNVDAASLLVAPGSPFGPAEWTDIRAQRDPAYTREMPPEYQDYPAWGGQPGLLKPDLVAPGDNSWTTARGGGYAAFSGTSAATPRVAGLAALLRQAVPSATPADVFRALATTARDLGPAGADNRHGSGLPDAAAALAALGPPLEIAALRVIDGGAPRGDGDDAPDAGEIDRLEITLRNTSSAAIDGVEVFLTAAADGRARVRDGYARLPRIEAGATATTPAPHLGVEFLAGSCGATAELRLEIRAPGGSPLEPGGSRVEPVFLAVGTETRVPLLDASFEADAGFTVGGTAPAPGAWVRVVPVGTTRDGAPMNPPADHTPDPGAMAYVTGNGPSLPDAADVDAGRAELTTPVRATTGYARVELRYARWFATSDPAGEDRFTVAASNDGATWRTLEEFTAAAPAWRERTIVLSDLLAPGAATRVRFSAEDAGADDTVEGGVDDVALVGVALACAPFTLAPGTPADVGPTLRLARIAGGHLRLTWDPPAGPGGVDPPLGYVVRTSARADAGFEGTAAPSVASWVERDGDRGSPGSLRFYLVESSITSP